MRRKIVVIVGILVFAVTMTACGGLSETAKTLSDYEINAVFDADNMTLEVEQKVSYINSSQTPLGEVKFHLYPNAYREGAKFCPAAVTVSGGITIQSVSVLGAEVEAEVGGEDQNILTVPLATELLPGKRAAIAMTYTLKIPKTAHRLGYQGGDVNLGNFYPVACAFKNGEFYTDPYYTNGDPFFADCANYKVALTLPIDYTVAASGSITAVRQDENTKTESYAISAARGFGMVLSKDFLVVSGMAGKTAVNYYHTGDEDAERTLATAIAAIKSFNSLFGQYPYSVYNVASTHFNTGGMEYTALVYINRDLSSAERESVVVHETAHQWWYGVVGNDEVRDPWMDEALAEYSTTLFYEKNPTYGKTRQDRVMDALKTYTSIASVFEVIKGEIDTSMTRSVNDYGTLAEYTCMIYIKGQLMFDSVRKIIGDDAFFKSLKSYYAANMYKVATRAHLIGAFENAASRDLEGVFNAWLDGRVVITELYSQS